MIIQPSIYPAPGGGSASSTVKFAESTSAASLSVYFGTITAIPSWFIAFPTASSNVSDYGTAVWVLWNSSTNRSTVGIAGSQKITEVAAGARVTATTSTGLRLRSAATTVVLSMTKWFIIYKE